MPSTLLIKSIKNITGSHSLWQVWQDWLLMCAVALSNASEKDSDIWKKRENQYLQTIKKYTKEEIEKLADCFRMLVDNFPDPATDLLGDIYMQLELGDKWRGQFFTPQTLSNLMAATILDKEEVDNKIKEKGFISLSEPSVGGGSTVIGFANQLKELGYNYQKHLIVTAVDVDIKSVHMAYVQLSLMGITAKIIHGNSLTLEEWDCWRTPFNALKAR